MAEAKKRKTVIGRVVSDKMDKTISVEVRAKRKHPLFGKYVPTRQVFYAHDEKNEAKVDDRVEISFTRPLSKKKRWKLDRIVEVAD